VKNQTVRIGLVQTRCTEDLEFNTLKAFEFTRQAIEAGAQIICLQELFNTPYFCREIDSKYFDWAIEPSHATIELFEKLAQDNQVTIILPFFEKRGIGIYHNSLIALNASGSFSEGGKKIYRKMHIPDDPGFYEKYYFTPGDLGFKAFDTPFAKIGALICWDQWFPEAARLTAMQGAEILFYPTAIAWWDKEPQEYYPRQLAAWEVMHRSHAIANNVFVVAVNRVGKEGELTFWGNSLVINPFGEIIAQTSSSNEEFIVVACELSEILYYRKQWPFFRDRRIDFYSPLTQRFGNPYL
jgi:N-carbamoylputrescine amidase